MGFGQRITVYGYIRHLTPGTYGTRRADGDTATILSTSDEAGPWVSIILDSDGKKYQAHRKQCREIRVTTEEIELVEEETHEDRN